ncbi:GM14474 [Drosophila sechellia]|uniref:adenylate cyclase n=1 Tax=Drosophila sechellia TaxID=7238 RepID=B4HW63_DROSE|nr:GM14474 [Drosophila sechellia]
MDNDNPYYQEDVVAYRSLSTVKDLEWRHLKNKCQKLRLELACSRLRELALMSNVVQIIWHVELLMVAHVILLLVLVKDVILATMVPYFAIMLFSPFIMLLSMQKNVGMITNTLISWLMALFLTSMDLFSDLLGTIYSGAAYPTVPCYDHVVLVSVYMTLPIAFYHGSSVYVLGMVVSIVYIGYAFYMQYLNDQISFFLLSSYAIYLLTLNLIFSFFTIIRDYGLRRAILSRYQLVYQNIVYQLVMKKENGLLESILPRKMIRTLQEEICSRIEDQDRNFTPPKSGLRKLFLEPYPDVSILVADMVNYTHLTTTLEAPQLVEILHDLFVNFDLAANRNRAMRIKFLGDSYNCVAGIPNYFPAHASCCVDQALEMIHITQGVSSRRELDINLRIGVHSGEVFAGIIGHTKWQFDIWSKDVDITNRLETSGLPGLVHVSQRTLSMLDEHYIFREGTEAAKNDPILQQAGIRTFLTLLVRLPSAALYLLIHRATYPDLLVLLGILLVLLILCILAGYKKLRLQWKRLTPMSQPSCFLSRWFLRISERIEDSLFVRVPLTILVLLLLYVMSSQAVFSCDVAKLELSIIEAHLHNEKSYAGCFGPWTVTYCVVIVISLLFVVPGCPLRSETTDLGLKSDYAHTWYLVALFIVLVLRERHVNYLRKFNYFMRVCYEEAHQQTDEKLRSIKIIMANILPTHVAQVYKVRRPHDQLYYENFSKVAVMFASIENFNADTAGLRILHEIICCFDDLLVDYQTRYKIEKIKVMGWTYLVACGLETDHYTDFSIDIPVKQPEADSEMRRRSSVLTVHFGSTEDDEMSGDNVSQPYAHVQDVAVLVMTEFALDLLRIMHDIRYNYMFSEYDTFLTGSLKIGISHGSVMAGVVGLSKPHYDIWGHTVNMASRMSSTGLLDNIQVTRHTAKVLRQFNIRCNYRGHTEVKGVGKVPTYLVVVDPDLTFQDHDQVSMSIKDSKSWVIDTLSLSFTPSFVPPKSSTSDEEEAEGELEENESEGNELEVSIHERQKGGIFLAGDIH